MKNTIYRVMGKRGRITIPYEFRQQVGFGYNDILSFTKQDDNTILCVAILLSAVVLVHSGILLPAAVSLCFGFLTIRAADETTIMDYLRYAVR